MMMWIETVDDDDVYKYKDNHKLVFLEWVVNRQQNKLVVVF